MCFGQVELEEVSGREGQSRGLLDQLTTATEQLEEVRQQVGVTFHVYSLSLFTCFYSHG